VYPLAKSGDFAQAKRVASEMLSEKHNGKWIPAYNLAVMSVGLRDFDQAFYWLNQCRFDRTCSLLEIETNPILGELGSDPRFESMRQVFGGNGLEADLH
jgi:hypothetical protein